MAVRHGTCDKFFRCTCQEGFQGSDCSERTCPFGNAWSDMAYATDYAHASANAPTEGCATVPLEMYMYGWLCWLGV